MVRHAGCDNADQRRSPRAAEVTQTDPFGEEKESTLKWLHTEGMVQGDFSQEDVEFKGVEFEDGDAFSVALREVVPPESRGQYREFAEAAP